MAGASPTVLPTDQQMADPCTFRRKTNITIDSTALLIGLGTGVANQKWSICSASVIVSSATKINFVEGVTPNCSSSSTAHAAIIGSTNSGRGLSLADNGGLTYGSGMGTVAASQYSSGYLCMTQSGTATLGGNIAVVQSSI